jgi:hypothetical protein
MEVVMSENAWRFLALPFVLAALVLVGAPDYPAISRAVQNAMALEEQAPAPTLRTESAPLPESTKVGMAPWAFRFALVGQLADVITTEVALSKGLEESNQLMSRRAVRVPLKLALPFVARWAMRKVPRAHANSQGLVLGGWGAGPAAWNVYAMLKWGG